MLLALIAVVGIGVPYVVWFTASPIDNFKFFTLASIALGLLAATAVDPLAERLSAGVRGALFSLLMLSSVGNPLLHVVARLMTVPDFLLVVRGETSRTALLPSRAWAGEHAAAQWLAGSMGREDRLLVLPAGARGTPYLLAFAGRFGAEASYSGYPGITLSERRLAARRVWLERARAFEPAALCEPPGLWIYAREDQLTLPEGEALRRAADAGWLRLAYRVDARDGRRAVFEACPHGPDALR